MLGNVHETVVVEAGIEPERSEREEEEDPGCALGNKCTIKCPRGNTEPIREKVKGS